MIEALNVDAISNLSRAAQSDYAIDLHAANRDMGHFLRRAQRLLYRMAATSTLYKRRVAFLLQKLEHFCFNGRQSYREPTFRKETW